MEDDRSNADKALDALEFRFTHADDVAAYGDRWYRYAEREIILLPARRLMDIEQMIRMPIVDVMNGIRASTILGDLAGTWLGLHLADPTLAPDFGQYEPHTMWIKWRKADDPKDQPVDGQDRAPSTPETSVSPDTVVLPTMPVAASDS